MKNASNLKQKLVSPVLMWAIVLVGVFVAARSGPKNEILGEASLFIFIALLAVMYWLYFFIGALAVHRNAPVSVAGIENLVTEGVYGMVRHPIYMADIVLAWGLFLLLPQVRFLIAVSWLTVVLATWMTLEERALEQKFGQSYRDYKKRVPMVLPRFKKK